MICSRLLRILVATALCVSLTAHATAARKGGGKRTSSAKGRSTQSRVSPSQRNANRVRSSSGRIGSQTKMQRAYPRMSSQPVRPNVKSGGMNRVPQRSANPVANRPSSIRPNKRRTIVPENRNQGRRLGQVVPENRNQGRNVAGTKRQAVVDRIKNSNQPRRAATTLGDKLTTRNSGGNRQRLSPFEPGPAPDRKTPVANDRPREIGDITNPGPLSSNELNDYVEAHKPDRDIHVLDGDFNPSTGSSPKGPDSIPGYDGTPNNDPNGTPTSSPDPDTHNPPDPPTHTPNDTPTHTPNDSPPTNNPHDDPMDNPPHNNDGPHGGDNHGGHHHPGPFRPVIFRPFAVGVRAPGCITATPCAVPTCVAPAVCGTGACEMGTTIPVGQTLVNENTVYQGETFISDAAVPVDAATAEINNVAFVDPAVIYEGQTMALPTADLGLEPGRVLLRVGGLTLNATVVDWNAEDMTFQVPSLGLNDSVAGSLSIVLASGAETEAIPVIVMPANLAPIQMTEAMVGSELRLGGLQFGVAPGKVELQVGNELKLPVSIVSWNADEARITLPMLRLAEASEAQLLVFNAAAELIDTVPVRMLPQTLAE